MKGSKQKHRFYFDEELNRISQHEFHAAIVRNSFIQKTQGCKIEIFACSFVILLIFSQAHKIQKERIFTSWSIVLLGGIVILYWLISSLID